MSDRRRKLTNRSPGTRGPRPRRRPGRAATIFAALGDRTRIRLLLALNAGSRRSITQLTMGSRSTRQAVLKGLTAGADGYLTKPFEPESVMRAVRTVLGLPTGFAAEPGHDPWINGDAKPLRAAGTAWSAGHPGA